MIREKKLEKRRQRKKVVEERVPSDSVYETPGEESENVDSYVSSKGDVADSETENAKRKRRRRRIKRGDENRDNNDAENRYAESKEALEKDHDHSPENVLLQHSDYDQVHDQAQSNQQAPLTPHPMVYHAATPIASRNLPPRPGPTHNLMESQATYQYSTEKCKKFEVCICSDSKFANCVDWKCAVVLVE